MRRDVYIDNDSGGFSVLAVDAVDDIIADQRSDDMQFVTGFKALLLELYGDDSLPVRFVVDEPLRKDEEEQWLARASWRIDTTDGRLMAMGGFDPDVLADWRDSGGTDDGRGIAIVDVPKGPLRVDVYAHVGSMNGRQILSDASEKPGTAFRRSHPGRAFPLWLTCMIEFSGEEDPGFEELWRDARASLDADLLSIDTESPAVIGFLIHVRADDHAPGDPPEGGWFARDENARVPKTFPVGLATDVRDPQIESQRQRLLGIADEPEAPQPVSETMAIIERWTGAGMKKIKDNTPPISINATDAYWLYWMAAMTAESPPAFEYWVAPREEWARPEPTEDYGVIPKGTFGAMLRPSIRMGGWGLWRGAKNTAALLATVPDGTNLDLAMAPRQRDDEEVDDDIGRALYEGVIRSGKFEIIEASPAIDRATLADALDFVGDLIANQRIGVRTDAERQAFEEIAAIYVPEDDRRIWDGDTVRLHEGDERELLLLASAVFRARFGAQWKCDPIDN